MKDSIFGRNYYGSKNNRVGKRLLSSILVFALVFSGLTVGMTAVAVDEVTLDLSSLPPSEPGIDVGIDMATVTGFDSVIIKGESSSGLSIVIENALEIFIENNTTIQGSGKSEAALVVPDGTVITGRGSGITITGGNGTTHSAEAGIQVMGTVTIDGVFGAIKGGNNTGQSDGGDGISAGKFSGQTTGGVPGHIIIKGRIESITGGEGGHHLIRAILGGRGLYAHTVKIEKGAYVGRISGGHCTHSLGYMGGDGIYAYNTGGMLSINALIEIAGETGPITGGDGFWAGAYGLYSIGFIGISGKTGALTGGNAVNNDPGRSPVDGGYGIGALPGKVVISGTTGDITGGTAYGDDGSAGHGIVSSFGLEISGRTGNITGGEGLGLGGTALFNHSSEHDLVISGTTGNIKGGDASEQGGSGIIAEGGFILAADGVTGSILGGAGIDDGKGPYPKGGTALSTDVKITIAGTVNGDIAGGNGIAARPNPEAYGGHGISSVGLEHGIRPASVIISGTVKGSIIGGNSALTKVHDDNMVNSGIFVNSLTATLEISGTVEGNITGGDGSAGAGITVHTLIIDNVVGTANVNISGTVRGGITGGDGVNEGGDGIYAGRVHYTGNAAGSVTIGGKVLGEIRGGSGAVSNGLDINTIGGSYSVLDYTAGRLIRPDHSNPEGGRTVTFDYTGNAPSEFVGRAYATAGNTIPVFTVPGTSGRSFQGWYTSRSGGRVWTPGVDLVTSDMTLYARWSSGVNPSPVRPSGPVTPVPELPKEDVRAEFASAEVAEVVADAVSKFAEEASESTGTVITQVSDPIIVSVGERNTIATVTLPDGVDSGDITTMAFVTESGEVIAVPTRINPDGTILVIVSGEVALVPLHIEPNFTDIGILTAGVQDELVQAAELLLVAGRGDGIFDPVVSITNQEAATIILRAVGIPVEYASAMETAIEQGLLSEGAVAGAELTRVDTAILIVNALKALDLDWQLRQAEIDELCARFNDLGELTADQKLAKAICIKLGIFQGHSDGRMGPNDVLNRYQMAILAVRVQDAVFGV